MTTGFFDPASAAAHVIRHEDEYSGVRASMTATLGRARLTFHVDVNVEDPVWPTPGPVTVPGLLGGHVELLGYPLPAVHAETIVTALQRGTANTRWRDLADVYLLRAQQDVDGTDLTTALSKVAEYRGITLRPLSDARVVRDSGLRRPHRRPGGPLSSPGRSPEPQPTRSQPRRSAREDLWSSRDR